MTVKELIEALKKFPEDSQVIVPVYFEYKKVSSVVYRPGDNRVVVY